MKKSALVLIVSLILTVSGITLAQKDKNGEKKAPPAKVEKFKCNDKEIAKACKPNMKPFKMDAWAPTELSFDKKQKKVEVQFSVFEGTNYKLVFCTSGFAEKVKLNIYDKSKAVKSRKKVYDGESGIDSDFWAFEPTKTGTYYIEYDVPAAIDSVPHKGCVVMLIGFK